MTGITTKDIFEKGPLAGPIFENYIICDILKNEWNQKTHAELFYLRTSNKEEIDLIIDRKQFKELIEIKNSFTFHPRMLKSIEIFLEKEDKAYLLYRGDNLPYSEQIEVLNYQSYLQHVEKKP